mgnify:CR=1 FL=1|jgi:hypothetical protein
MDRHRPKDDDEFKRAQAFPDFHELAGLLRTT